MAMTNSLVFFGPQLTRLNQASLSVLQKSLLIDSRFEFLVDAVADLPSSWSALVEALPSLTKLQGPVKLEALRSFVQGSEIPGLKMEESNILIAPLTVLSHLVAFLRRCKNGGTSICLDDGSDLGAAQGFCIGFLSAAAVSSSRNLEEFRRHAVAALRLALCVGAVVDMERRSNAAEDRGTSIVLRWTKDSQRPLLEQTLSLYPLAYISCVTDEKSVTVTVPFSEANAFELEAAEKGFLVHPIRLHGRYHHSVHADAVESIEALCGNDIRFQLPKAADLVLPLRFTSDGTLVREGSLHAVALHSILIYQAQWFETVKATVASAGSNSEILSIGSEGFMPREIGAQSQRKSSSAPTINGSLHMNDNSNVRANGINESAVAVVGMACRFPQADSLEQFWQLLRSGLNAVGSVPSERFKASELWREPKGPFFGNFLKDADAFDNRFFNISGREAKSMDPQQRVLLEVVYQALESSGFLVANPAAQQNDIGCYVGVGSVDYEDNVASENATAFSATGSLRAFISGRVSHYFGWSGPSITFDTACSSSAVAIHSACKALLAKECSMAIAGGVNVITSPKLFQNLGAGRFLNPTGPSKAFDAGANGYCRGEGAGVVVLKPLSRALAEDDMILGVISGSAVNQGSNDSPITVPDSKSQSTLYRRALSTSSVDPWQVSYVEAHGTGTPVGDPIEYESIRRTFTDEKRTDELYVGSVKDNIGHAEAASGAAGLVKTLLMLQHRMIPKQANFSSLNSKIVTSPADQMGVPTQTKPWESTKRVAVVNNYGAAGSNAAIVVEEYPASDAEGQPANDALPVQALPFECPFIITAKTPDALQSYCRALDSFISRQPRDESILSNIANNMAKKHNRAFDYSWISTASSIEDLREQLKKTAAGPGQVSKVPQKTRSVVLCFGGQNGTTANISEELFHSSKVLRSHLSSCESACRQLGLPSLFPRIFRTEPVDDIVHLHSMLFAIQYACAKSWIASGLEVGTLIGHSFGQLTALCVAGCLSLIDALRLVSERARLIQEQWGSEPGTMLSIEGDSSDVELLLESAKQHRPTSRVEISCYNGPRNFVIAGNRSAIEAVEDVAAAGRLLTRLKLVRLKNTHAYHSFLTESILPGLREVAESLRYQQPSIPIETCSAERSWSKIGPGEILEHTRSPVFFSGAVQRIAERTPIAIWLEAGSASSIIPMVRRVFRDSGNTGSDHSFMPTDLGPLDGQRNLAKVTAGLWHAGSRVQFWSFHCSQKSQYRWLSLPPYQFEKARHWIQYKPSVDTSVMKPAVDMHPKNTELIQLHGNFDRNSAEVHFVIDPTHPVFDLCSKGHAVLNQSLCPASMYVELVVRAVRLMDMTASTSLPKVEDLEISSPLSVDPTRGMFLVLKKETTMSWSFSLYSNSHGRPEKRTAHAGGRVALLTSTANHFRSMNRLITKARCDQIRQSPLTTGLLGQALVYKTFGNVVDYATYYQGVHSIFAQDSEAVGHVVVPKNQPLKLEAGACDPVIMDNFLQVSGIHVNCLSERKDDEVFMCTSIGDISFTKSFPKRDPGSWTVYSNFERPSRGSAVNDIFVLDSASGELVLTIMGCQFRSVPFKFLSKALSSLNATGTSTDRSVDIVHPSPEHTPVRPVGAMELTPPQTPPPEKESPIRVEDGQNQAALLKKVQEMLSEVMEIPISDIRADLPLEELGVDSLMQTEVLTELNKRFDTDISMAEFQALEDIRAICKAIQPDSFGKELVEPEALVKKSDLSAPVTNGVQSEGNDGQTLASLAIDCFGAAKHDYDEFAGETGFSRFCSEVHPLQSDLVVAYIVEALAKSGCDLQSLRPGDKLSPIYHLPQHTKVMNQIYAILEEARLVIRTGNDIFRTGTPVPDRSTESLQAALVQQYPKHASEHKLLHTTGHKLSECLTGKADPIGLLFGNATARKLLEDVYTNAPMFKTGSLLLVEYLCDLFQKFGSAREIRILELGAGTGGTTKLLTERLAGCGRKFSYTFTDLSSSLVTAAKKKFAHYTFMKYTTMDIEKEPPSQHLGQYDIVISTNCIHATRNLVNSATNINKCLRPDGILCLVELTRNLFWFDLVFGLLEGWWLFNDGRQHALASETLWERNLKSAGFKWVDWSHGTSDESNILRVITASPFEGVGGIVEAAPPILEETVVFKEENGQGLFADIYYPKGVKTSTEGLPVALMIHGGGHVMLSRKDIRPKQTEILLEAGFLPVTVDYRLCPEMTLVEGPMRDVCDALQWVRTSLPNLPLQRKDIRINGDKVVVVGWSTGGQVAMTLAWTAPESGIRPPEAILAFYCPTDYEDPFWSHPNIPQGSLRRGKSPELDHDVWEGVFDKPITAYNPPSSSRALGGWMTPSDPRSRIALYMNWAGKTVDVLVNGLKRGAGGKLALDDLPRPSKAEVIAISPLAQILHGAYRTPTFLIHGTRDDLIPWEQAQRTYQELKAKGVESDIRVVNGAIHLFDLYRGGDVGECGRVIQEGYAFLRQFV